MAPGSDPAGSGPRVRGENEGQLQAPSDFGLRSSLHITLYRSTNPVTCFTSRHLRFALRTPSDPDVGEIMDYYERVEHPELAQDFYRN
jgi:hypothetical protein